MFSNDDLDQAVAAGAISADVAAALRAHLDANSGLPAVDEEQFRLLTGFNDIFVSIAAVILLFSVGFIGQQLGPTLSHGGPSPLAGLLVAATAWGLALFFTAKRRMALPSIILLLAFVGGLFAAGAFLGALLVGENEGNNGPVVVAMIGAGSAALAAVGAWFHWRRFHVPITVAAGAAAVAGFLFSLLATAVPESPAKSDLLHPRAELDVGAHARLVDDEARTHARKRESRKLAQGRVDPLEIARELERVR